MIPQISTICPSQIFIGIYSSSCRHHRWHLRSFRHRRPSNIVIQKSLSDRISEIASKAIGSSCPFKLFPKQSREYEDFSVAQFIRFLKQIKLKKLLSRIKDPRKQNKISYTNDVILQWALTVYFFKQGSCNALQTALQKLRPEKRTAILKYLGLRDDTNSFPHRTVVNDCLKLIEADEVNELLIHLFICFVSKYVLFYVLNKAKTCFYDF
jgi:hypothetical protein